MLRRLSRRRAVRFFGIAVALFAVVGGVAYATIPDASGVYHACLKNGSIRMIDSATEQCKATETEITWSKTGQPGPAGPAGPQGPQGPTDTTADTFVGQFGTNTNGAAAANGETCTLGQILLTASTNHTAGGLPASGQLLPINQNQALFALIGTTYGGNGVTSFALPDMRAIAPNNMTYSICTQGIFPSSN